MQHKSQLFVLPDGLHSQADFQPIRVQGSGWGDSCSVFFRAFELLPAVALSSSISYGLTSITTPNPAAGMRCWPAAAADWVAGRRISRLKEVPCVPRACGCHWLDKLHGLAAKCKRCSLESRYCSSRHGAAYLPCCINCSLLLTTQRGSIHEVASPCFFVEQRFASPPPGSSSGRVGVLAGRGRLDAPGMRHATRPAGG